MSTERLRNIGPKSAAWLRQVGVRSGEDLQALGAVAAFVKVRRAGFKPSLNMLYALEGALQDCHWQEIPEARRHALLAEYETASAALPSVRGRPVGGPVETRHYDGESQRADHDDAEPAHDEDDAPMRDRED
ncbi:TfoX/Sxy family protein [Xanthomonas maliensis]|uniref:TfoX/Sxy family protein n=1 Tax=Xanthomonas maliensis TaxID=1321368 RepID=UPI0003A0090B|nr:TfoX/Sxy family protein [Xanthomonas maliensis]KAB7765842.1 transcriptional regulator [Xanthomonas maliensis]